MFDVIAHADWSVCAGKRWHCVARRSGAEDAVYRVSAPRPVGDVGDYFDRLLGKSASDSVLSGLDFPLGLPLDFARQAGIEAFCDVLPAFGSGAWSEFFDLCQQPADISVHRPFYPQRPGGTRHAELCQSLGVESIDQLRRLCERRTQARAAASPLFWTLGGQQVGRAAISGWRDLLQPALRNSSLDLRLWPFEGNLKELCAPGRIVVAETYPAESGLHLGLPATGRGWSKRRQADRRGHAGTLRHWAERQRVTLDDELLAGLDDGFGPHAAGEDQFDSTVGVLGMLAVALGQRREAPILSAETRKVEGWIFGQAESPETNNAAPEAN